MSSDALSKVFDVEVVEVISDEHRTDIIPPEGNEDEDHRYARAKHYELAEKGSEALDIAMRIARESENPKAIEALSGLLKSLTDVNKSLLILNKDKAEIKKVKNGKDNNPQLGTNVGTAVQNQTNIVFAGTSKDLNKLIKEQINKKTGE